MAALDLALLPGTFLVDFLPIRIHFSRIRALLKTSYNVYLNSQIRPGMVARGRFQKVCEDREEEYRRFHHPSVPICQRIF